MSPLWKKVITKQQKTIHKRPSPKHSHRQNFAQSLLSIQDRFFPLPLKVFNSIEGISLFISKRSGMEASMTVEASVVLPLFIFFFLNLSSAIEMIRLHGNIQLALWEAGNNVTVYGGMLEDLQEDDVPQESFWRELAGVAGAYIYMREQVVDYLGANYLENSPLERGVDSLQFIESDVYESMDCFEVVATYQVSPMKQMAGFFSFRMANKYYGHLWNGYEIPQGELFVYITENGRVYHTSRECTHLQLTVRKVGWREACDSQNAQGRQYEACDKCCDSVLEGEVYITEDGNHYHNTSSCAGLKRTIICVPVSEVEKWSLCSRCEKEAGK